ncbi:MAG: NAD-dependent epimerase/dehydratase family protein [Rhodocyclaceae bacterium]|jgi:dTDP-L-rhamnose 4-epimerase|nr:NAD-dependent epimerase/dehydratase family protein [Rhodocyclaceae bacterium]
MTQRVLVTGGAGFIGSRLSLRLLDAGYRVSVLDNLSPQIHGDDSSESPLFRTIAGKVDFVKGDVTCREDVLKALPGADVVVHLAAETGTGQSMYAIRHYADVNVGGTALLLDLIANERFPIRRLVVASSRAVYGEGKYQCPVHGISFPGARAAAEMEKGFFEHTCPHCADTLLLLPTDETSALHPSSVYGVTKLTQEQLFLSVGAALGVSTLAFRYQNVYGPGQSLSNPYTGILSIFSTRLRHGNPINIFEDGKESRDFVFIDDVVEATMRGIEHPDTKLIDAFNVGSGSATDVLTIATTLRRYLGGQSEIAVTGHFRAGDIRHNVADLTKVSRALGFRPAVSIEEGLCRFVEWVQGARIERDRFEDSLAELRDKGLFK